MCIVRYQKACAAWWHWTQSHERAFLSLRMQTAHTATVLLSYHIAYLEKKRHNNYWWQGTKQPLWHLCVHTNSLQCFCKFKGAHGPRGILIKIEKCDLKEKVSRKWGTITHWSDLNMAGVVPAECADWSAEFLLVCEWDWRALWSAGRVKEDSTVHRVDR